MSKFKVGDKVRIIDNQKKGESWVDHKTSIGDIFILKEKKDVCGGVYWYFQGKVGTGSGWYAWEDQIELVSNKRKNMSVKSKIKQIMRSEPEKTFVEVGFLDDNENITEDGRAILEQILWDANKDKLKELADKVIESEND